MDGYHTGTDSTKVARPHEAYPDWQNLAVLFFDCARAWGDRPAVWRNAGAGWQPTTWRVLARTAASLATTLQAHGVAAGDRVLILSENRPEFLIADVAVMALGAIAVPVFTTYTADDLAHVLRDCAPTACVVSTSSLYAKAVAADGAHPTLDVVIGMEGVQARPGPAFVAWDEAIRLPAGRSAEAALADLEAAAQGIERERIACLIYTSGTGGNPKGVALPHRAILSNCKGAHALLAPLQLENEVYLSFLPLSHSFEHTCGQFFLLSIGTQVYYSQGAERLAHEMTEVRPTAMTAVPRLFEVIKHRIESQVAKAGWLPRKLFAMALTLGRRRIEQGSLVPPLAWIDRLLDRLVRRKVQARFGGRLKGIMSGGARLDPEVGRFFLALGVPILQGYGQTEAGPVISANPPDRIRIDTVGRLLDGVELRIDDDGEILVRGDLVMAGYWNNAEATARVLDSEGWLRTGDIGTLDPDGYLRITDRKKDILVLSGGDNVSPARVEAFLTAEPSIAQAAVAGDGRAYLVAVLVPQDGAAQERIAADLERANARLAVHERIRRFTVASEPFTVENGLLTPTLKLKRLAVRERYRTALEKLYG